MGMELLFLGDGTWLGGAPVALQCLGVIFSLTLICLGCIIVGEVFKGDKIKI